MTLAATLLTTRSLRAFADGCMALLLPLYLTGLGLGPLQVGIVTTATLLGSAVLTLATGLAAHRFDPRALLLAAAGLMIATGLAFTQVRDFWPLLAVAFVGTLNPSSGDVSLLLPLEHSLLAHAGPDSGRTALFARYGLLASLSGAAGALAAGAPQLIHHLTALPVLDGIRLMFAAYALAGVVSLLLYRRLPPQAPEAAAARAPLGPSRRNVLMLSGLFAMDSFGSGFMVQSLLALWLYHRFGLSPAAAGAFFFWMGLLGAASLPVSVWLSRRIGLVRTMVFTHIPANLCIVLAGLSHSLPLVMGLLLMRAALQQMDVPARNSYVMAIVTPAERAAAAGVTAVPRSLASAVGPTIAGGLMAAGLFAAPLAIGGGIKTLYDLLLLWMFQNVRPPEERA